MNKYDRKHLANIASIQKRIETIYTQAAKEAARIGVRIDKIDPEKLFSLDDYPAAKKEIDKLIKELADSVNVAIVNGIRSSWTLSNNKNDEISRQVFGDNVGKLTQAQYRRYFSTNGEALDAFLERKRNGLNLSDRVWRYTEAFRNEIELGLDVGIRNGMSAAEMSRELRDWLRYPDMLFRRVRDEHGDLQLSQRAAMFHPGQGVYRSSYMNARRLAATETNIAYRTADHERWRDLDFVVGIRVVLSNNHTCLGSDGKPHKFEDICDKLSAEYGSTNTSGRGCYPKDFKFTGWHPHCRCHAESILKTDEEIAEDNRRILEGEEPMDYKQSEKYVKDVPKEFEEWLDNNKERAKRSYSMPYFIKDNEKYLPDGYKSMYGMRVPYDTFAEYEQAMAYNKKYADFSDAIKANNRDLSGLLPVMQGKIMNMTEADGMKVNPHFSDMNAVVAGYYSNCQTCTMAYELRRRGFNIEAAPSPLINNVPDFYHFCARKKTSFDERWLLEDGRKATRSSSYRTISKNTKEEKLKYIEESTGEVGRYEILVQWNSRDGHVFCLERTKDGNLIWFDPQSGRKGGHESFDDYLGLMMKNGISILRIDDKIINPVFSELFLKSSKNT